MKSVFKIILLMIIVNLSFVQAQTKHAMTPEDIWKMLRIGSMDISPDGSLIVFSVSKYSMEKNKGDSDIWIASVDGKEVKPILSSSASESSPKFSPDGKHIFFSKKGQIYSCNYSGMNIKKVTDVYTGVSGIEFNKSGDKFLFVSDVYPNCKTQECNKKEDLKRKNDKKNVKVITGLMFRVWNHWRGDKRSHLFIYNLRNNKITDLTEGSSHDVPPLDLGSGHDYGFSPEGDEIAYTMNKDKVNAISTNNDIFTVSLTETEKTGKVTDRKISVSKGNDNQPVYSPDGKYIAFRSMAHAGFEADKSTLMIYNRETGDIKNLTENFDRSVGEIVWAPDSKTIYFTSANYIYNSIYKIDLLTGEINLLVEKHVNSDIHISPDGKTLYFKQQRSTQPYEIFSLNLENNKTRQITHLNKELLAQLLFNDIETFWTKSNDGTKIEAILVKPPHFNPDKKYPLIFLIHGGPQGHWTDDFHYRWNIQQFAAPGYVVVAANPRGSVGYGQDFTNAVSGDWGGKPYEDLMSVLDNSLKRFPFIDKNNLFAAGASYGGFMINWIEGHTDRFNALFSHDGVYDQRSMYGETEELWFPEWEFKGTPWTNPELYAKWSPSSYVKNFNTPMLIVQGGHDFRVPQGQAFQLFTALQRVGVESKLLYFPNETHFVTKPQNAKFWWHSLFDWFEQHKK